jgi:hypothetical protein
MGDGSPTKQLNCEMLALSAVPDKEVCQICNGLYPRKPLLRAVCHRLRNHDDLQQRIDLVPATGTLALTRRPALGLHDLRGRCCDWTAGRALAPTVRRNRAKWAPDLSRPVEQIAPHDLHRHRTACGCGRGKPRSRSGRRVPGRCDWGSAGSSDGGVFSQPDVA